MADIYYNVRDFLATYVYVEKTDSMCHKEQQYKVYSIATESSSLIMGESQLNSEFQILSKKEANIAFETIKKRFEKTLSKDC